MSAPKLNTQTFTFDPRPQYPLLTTVKRYWDPTSNAQDDPTALTLVFAHGTGFHKEHWEPVIDDLFEVLQTKGKPGISVRECWTIDAPNHGDAAILNEGYLQWGYEPIFRWEEYARIIHSFLAGFGTGVEINFKSHNLVGIGHSMGAVSLLQAMNYHPPLPFTSMILIEPMSMSKAAAEGPGSMLVSGSANRRDIWSSKEDAYVSLKNRKAWKAWDDRILRIYVEHGMRPLPTLEYPDKLEGVTLKCTRKQETASYRDNLSHTLVYRNLSTFAKRVPIHLVYGAIDDYLPAEVKNDVINNAAGGAQNLASMSRVERAGHLAPQVNPRGVAEHVLEALMITPGFSQSQARL